MYVCMDANIVVRMLYVARPKVQQQGAAGRQAGKDKVKR